MVFACASTSHLPSAEAILEGFEIRKKQGRRVGILIYTVQKPLSFHPAFSPQPGLMRLFLFFLQSGTGIFATGDARGLPPSPRDRVYSDLDVAAIERLGTAHSQRKVHVKIIAAAEAGHVQSYIILPGTIFGISTESGAGPIFNRHSNQMPALIRAGIKRKRAGLVGKHENTCKRHGACSVVHMPRNLLTT